MESVWSTSTTLPQQPPLQENRSTQVAIIGGGMAGILTAWRLKQAGISAIVLEARQIASGETKNTTAKITALHGACYSYLMQTFDKEVAAMYWKANQEAIEEYRKIIQQHQISCDWQEQDARLYTAKQPKILEEEAKVLSMLRVHPRLTNKSCLPFPISAVLSVSRQAQFHPLQFLRALIPEITFYENTTVKKIESNQLITNRGIVKAEEIVFASHYPFQNFPGYYFLRMHQERSYVLGLENAMQSDAMYLGIDEGGLSLRNAGNLLLLGGGSHRAGENTSGGRYDTLRRIARHYWQDNREVAHWSAQDCMTLDQIPYIGRFSSATPHQYVATGFGKWGMTGAMISSLLLTDLICQKHNPYEKLFSPQRFTPAASSKRFFIESGHAIKGLADHLFDTTTEQLNHLLPGQGGIVRYQGKKMGAYRDSDGSIYLVSLRCPHLGCQLTWNPDEKSWDCPCHGSRFDIYGKPINNPAQKPLSLKKIPNSKSTAS